MVGTRKRDGRTANDRHVLELESLGGVRGQKLHRVILDPRKRNCASRLYKIIEVLEKFGWAPSLGNRFLVPGFHKLHKRDDRSRPLQAKVTNHNVGRIVRANSVLLNFPVRLLNARQHRRSVRQASQHRA